MSRATPLPKHMPALDGLRGVAILLVVLTHVATGWVSALSIYQDTSSWPGTFSLPRWMDVIAGNAAHGVTLFFVVSAFTLTVRAAQNRQDSLRSYALRRVARIGPGFWLAGICYAAGVGLGPRFGAPHGMGPLDLAVAAIVGGAWQGGAAEAVVPGGWSVSCEVAFYVALPAVMWATDCRFWRALSLTALASIVAQLCARHGMAYTHPIEQAPVFMGGATAAFAMMRVTLPRLPGAAVMLLIFGICAVPFSPILNWFVLLHIQFAVPITLAVAFAATNPSRILASWILRRIGEVSYSMYLLHFAVLAPCLHLAEWLAPGHGWPTMLVQYALTSIVSFGCACVTYRFVEQPAIRWMARRVAAPKASPSVWQSAALVARQPE